MTPGRKPLHYVQVRAYEVTFPIDDVHQAAERVHQLIGRIATAPA